MQITKKVSSRLCFNSEQAVRMNTKKQSAQKRTSRCLLGTNMGQRSVYGQHGDHAVTSPGTQVCGTHLSAAAWQSRLLSLHLPWHNQQKLWLVGPPVPYTDKLQQPIRAQKACSDHVCGHQERCDCDSAFLTYFQHWGLDFFSVTREHNKVSEARVIRTAVVDLQGKHLPVQISSHQTWSTPFVLVPPPGTAALDTHALLGPGATDKHI